MKTPVYQLFVDYPEAGVGAVLADILALELPLGTPNRIAVAGFEGYSNRTEDVGMDPRHTDISRMMRNGRVFDRAELRALLQESTVSYGWYFFGSPLAKGEPVEPVNVPRLLERSAYVVDVLEGNMLGVRTIHRGLADELRSVIVDVVEVEPCELEAVQLMY